MLCAFARELYSGRMGARPFSKSRIKETGQGPPLLRRRAHNVIRNWISIPFIIISVYMCTTRVVQSCVLDMRYRDTEKLGEEGRGGGYKCGCWVFSVRDYHPCRAAGIFPFVS